MSYQNGRSYTDFRALNLKAAGGAIRFETPTTTPTTTSGERLLYVDSSNQLIFDTGSTTITIGAAGAGSASSLDAAYDIGATISVDSGTVGMSGVNEDTAVLTLSGDAASAGALLLFSHSGTGTDITGSGSTWNVTSAGVASVVEVILADNEPITLGTGSDATIAWNGTLLNIAGATDFDNAVTTQSTVVVAGGAGSAGITLTAGELVLSDGAVQITDADNAASLIVTNNTASTIAGVVLVTCDGLTSGTGIRVDNTAAGMTTGNFYDAYDGAAIVWEVGDNGATTIAGAGGSDMITITAGDVLISDGAIAITDADNANSLSITNNTITTGDLVDFNSTSISTGALVKLNANTAAHDGEVLELISAGDATSTPVGLSISIPSVTTGAARGIEVTMVGSTTTAKGIAVTMDAITTGDMLYLDNGGGTLTGAGRFINCNDDDTSLFSVAGDGATVIAGTASGTDALTLTAGDATLTSGDLTLTLGELVLTDTDATTFTSINGTGSVVTVTSGGALGADKAGLEVVATNAGSNADSAVVRITQDHLTGASFCMNLKQDDLDVAFINFEGTASADELSPISTHGTGTTTDFVRCSINGTLAWVPVVTGALSA